MSLLIGTRRALLGRGGPAAFSLDAYLASLSDGLYFDTTKLDRFFQEAIGPTLADDPGEPIGLAFDQRTWGGLTLAQTLAAQSELRASGSALQAGTVTAPSYNSTTGAATITRIDGGNQGAVSIPTTPGATYAVDISTGSAAILVRDGAFGTIFATLPPATTTTVYVVPTTTTMTFALGAAATTSFTVNSVKRVPGNHAQQATGTLKPTRQTAGAKFDGSDDRLGTAYKVAGTQFMVGLVNFPASVASTQVFCGAQGANTNRFFVGIATDGLLRYGVGDEFGSAASIDMRGLRLVVGLSCNGAQKRVFVDGAMVSESAQSGLLTADQPIYVGCHNNASSLVQFFSGGVERLMLGSDHLTLERYLQIRNALLAA